MTEISQIWIMLNFILKSFLFCSVLRFADVRLYSHVLLKSPFFYRPQRSCGKVMFSQASVILFTGGGRAWQGACVAGGCVWQERRPLQRMVRILLECIIVFGFFAPFKAPFTPSESGSKGKR